MAKIKTLFVCQSCGAQSPKWAGRCYECESWNTMVEELQERGGRASAGGGSVALFGSDDLDDFRRGLGGDELFFEVVVFK